jgi:hypothetical protein
LLHGMAHQHLGISLTAVQEAFVLSVIVMAPLVALALFFTRLQQWAAGLLLLSMLGSLLFGVANHFVLISPDHILHLPAGEWARSFQITAILLSVTECIGCLLGWLGLRSNQ